MPQVTKGGKFIFGWSRIREGGILTLPPQAVSEYDIVCEGRVILFTGSKSTGGFCVTRHGLWMRSKLGFVLAQTPAVSEYADAPYTWRRIKGRSYCWAPVTNMGELALPSETLTFLNMKPNDLLLSIRSSDIAFTMGHHGPLVERARNYAGTIGIY